MGEIGFTPWYFLEVQSFSMHSFVVWFLLPKNSRIRKNHFPPSALWTRAGQPPGWAPRLPSGGALPSALPHPRPLWPVSSWTPHLPSGSPTPPHQKGTPLSHLKGSVSPGRRSSRMDPDKPTPQRLIPCSACVWGVSLLLVRRGHVVSQVPSQGDRNWKPPHGLCPTLGPGSDTCLFSCFTGQN